MSQDPSFYPTDGKDLVFYETTGCNFGKLKVCELRVNDEPNNNTCKYGCKCVTDANYCSLSLVQNIFKSTQDLSFYLCDMKLYV